MRLHQRARVDSCENVEEMKSDYGSTFLEKPELAYHVIMLSSSISLFGGSLAGMSDIYPRSDLTAS